jgi:uncharacterized membrane protein
MEFIGVLAAIVLILTPILAISAFIRVQNLTQQLRSTSLEDILSRLSALEQHLHSLEKSLKSREAAAAPPIVGEQPPVAPPPVPAPILPPPPVAPLPPLAPRGTARPSGDPIPPPQVNIFAAPPLHRSQPKSFSALDWEMLIGGRWLNRIAILAIISCVTFFLKYAFDNNWIGPSGRVAIGVLLGAAMLPWSHWLLQRGYSYFSEGIAGLGAAVLYLSIWAGCQFYKLYSLDVGFFAMIVITAAMAAIALGRNSQRIALLSLFGGFLTPVLVSEGKDAQVVLFTYL